MRKHLYAIRDTKAELCGPIMECRREAEAVRNFFQALNTDGTTLKQHPADFELVLLGYKDEATGDIETTDTDEQGNSYPVKRTVMDGATYLQVLEAQQRKQQLEQNDPTIH